MYVKCLYMVPRVTAVYLTTISLMGLFIKWQGGTRRMMYGFTTVHLFRTTRRYPTAQATCHRFDKWHKIAQLASMVQGVVFTLVSRTSPFFIGIYYALVHMCVIRKLLLTRVISKTRAFRSYWAFNSTHPQFAIQIDQGHHKVGVWMASLHFGRTPLELEGWDSW